MKCGRLEPMSINQQGIREERRLFTEVEMTKKPQQVRKGGRGKHSGKQREQQWKEQSRQAKHNSKQ